MEILHHMKNTPQLLHPTFKTNKLYKPRGYGEKALKLSKIRINPVVLFSFFV